MQNLLQKLLCVCGMLCLAGCLKFRNTKCACLKTLYYMWIAQPDADVYYHVYY